MLVTRGNGPRDARRRLCNGSPEACAGGSGRQQHADRRAAADGARRLDAAAVRVDEVPHDRQAEAGAALRRASGPRPRGRTARRCAAGAPAAMPMPVSLTSTHTPPSARARAQRDAPLARVAHRVLDEVGERPAGTPSGRRARASRPARCRRRARAPFAAAAGWIAVNTSCTTPATSTCATVRAPAAALDARQVEQVVDDALHARRVVADRLDEPAPLLGGMPSSSSVSAKPLTDGERRLELVRHVRDEVAPHRLEPAEHREVEQRHHGAAVPQRPRVTATRALVQRDLRRRRRRARERRARSPRAATRRAAGARAGREAASATPSSDARPLVDAHDHAALVDARCTPFLERLEHRGHELVVRLERVEARRRAARPCGAAPSRGRRPRPAPRARAGARGRRPRCARATSRSSTTGCETLRANSDASASAPSSATSPLTSTSRCAPAHDLVESPRA